MSVLSYISVFVILKMTNLYLAADVPSLKPLKPQFPNEPEPVTLLNLPTVAVEITNGKLHPGSTEAIPVFDKTPAFAKNPTTVQVLYKQPTTLASQWFAQENVPTTSKPQSNPQEVTTASSDADIFDTPSDLKATLKETAAVPFSTPPGETQDMTPPSVILMPPPTGLTFIELRTESLPEHFMPLMMTIFDEVGSSSSTFLDRILLIESQVCSNTCRGSYPRTFSNRRSVRDKCHRCHCDALCAVYQDCCPDVLLLHNVTYEDEPMTNCTSLVPVPYTNVVQKTIPEFVAFRTKCSEGFEESDDAWMCENPDITDPSQSLPVSSRASGRSYRNIYCARCNNDTADINSWSTSVSCQESPTELMTSISSKKELFQTLMSPDEVNRTGCELTYTRVSDARLCSDVSSDLISSCNVTGVWRMYDSRFVEACAMYTSPFKKVYKNMFCYLCNTEFPMTYHRFFEYVRFCCSAHVARLSFSALLDFTEDNSEQQISADCMGNEFYDTQECQCRKPKCSEGKFLNENGTCQSLLRTNFLGYNACSRVNVVLSEPPSSMDIDVWNKNTVMSVRNPLKKIQSWVSDWCPGDKTASLRVNEQYMDYGYLEDFEMIIKSRDEFHANIAKFVFGDVVQEISTVIIHPCQAPPRFSSPCSSNRSVTFYVAEYERGLLGGFEESKMYYIEYMETNGCPHIELPLHHLKTFNGSEYYVFEPTNRKINISRVDKISDSWVRVCVSDYKIITEQDVEICRINSDDFDTWTVSGLVSIICTCISLLCLLLTFITYVLLDPLRSAGGKNIMTLTVALFAAQAFYEFAIEQFENTSVCKAFGIIIHYTWLAAVFSMNACTVERFYKLCFPLSSRSVFMSKKPFILSTTYTLLCPAVIVGLNVIVNQTIRGDIGYGSPTLCYINTSMSRILAFGLPMGILILVNTGLFLFTVWNLRRRKSLGEEKSNSQNRVNLVACVRLSIVTGLMWLLVFLYDVISSQYLGYVITALIGLQGVLFFLSLVINKRVLGMYAKFFCTKGKGKVIYSSNLQNSQNGKSKGSSGESGSKQETKSTDMSETNNADLSG